MPGNTSSRERSPRLNTPSSPVSGTSRQKAHAAPTQDAALLIEHDGRPQLERPFFAGRRGSCRSRAWHAVVERVVLQLALTGLVADRAVERVVDQQQLHHALARVASRDRSACGSPCRRFTGVLQAICSFGHAFDLDLAQAARAVDRELRMPAVVRDLDAVHQQAQVVDRLEDRAALRRPRTPVRRS